MYPIRTHLQTLFTTIWCFCFYILIYLLKMRIFLYHAEIILHVSLKNLQFRNYKKYYLIVNFYTKPANQAISMNTRSLSNSSYSSYTDLPAMTEYQLPWTYVRSEPKR